MTNLLEMRDVTKTFHSGPLWQRETTLAVDRVSFAVSAEQPKITGVVGESGSGKTTLARLIVGLEMPSEGRIALAGKDSSDPDFDDHRRRHRCVLPQQELEHEQQCIDHEQAGHED